MDWAAVTSRVSTAALFCSTLVKITFFFLIGQLSPEQFEQLQDFAVCKLKLYSAS
jgi:hypothetical protein